MNLPPELAALLPVWLEPFMDAMLAALMVLLSGLYRRRRWRRILTDALVCALLAWFMQDLLILTGMDGGLSQLASVLLGWAGNDVAKRVLSRFYCRRISNDLKKD